MKVAIIGGGIGGLITALKLNEARHDVTIFECRQEINPAGFGVNLQPRVFRILTQLGLANIISRNAVPMSRLQYFDKFGNKFWSEPLGQEANCEFPMLSIHYGLLILLLREEVRRRIGENAFKSGFELLEFFQTGKAVIARFKNSETGKPYPEEITDILIGADGVSSTVRRFLYPSENSAACSATFYHGMTTMQSILNGSSISFVGDKHKKMMFFPVNCFVKGEGCIMNWYVTLREKEINDAQNPQDETTKQHLAEAFADWNFDWLNIPEMIENAEYIQEIQVDGSCNPLTNWSLGRVTLLGDAARPMPSLYANGVSQTIIDAYALGQYLTQSIDPLTALLKYSDECIANTTPIILQNNQGGMAEPLNLMDEWFPEGFTPEQIPHEKLRSVMQQYHLIAGTHDN